MIEALENELPRGTIRFGAKIVSIEEEENLKLVHLADGSVLKTKVILLLKPVNLLYQYYREYTSPIYLSFVDVQVLIGCDGVNSVVAKWLGLQRPAFAGRLAIRGCADFPEGHGLKPNLFQYFGDGFRSGFAPCDDRTVFWFFTYSSSNRKPLYIRNYSFSNFFLLMFLSA